MKMFLLCAFLVVVSSHLNAARDINNVNGYVNTMLDGLKGTIEKQKQDFNKKFQQGNATDSTGWKIKLKKLSLKIDQALGEIWDLLDEEHQTMTELQKNLSSFQSQLVVLNADIRNDFQKRLTELENKVKQDSQQMQKKVESMMNASLQNQANNFQTKISQQNQQISKLSAEVAKPSTWPAGSYCIFKSGPCPPGFVANYGFINAIKTYAADHRYIRAMTFGNSRMGCHGGCGQYGPYGDLQIHTCCK